MRHSLRFATLVLFLSACTGDDSAQDTGFDIDSGIDTEADTEHPYGDFSLAEGTMQTFVRNGATLCIANYNFEPSDAEPGHLCEECDGMAEVNRVFLDDSCTAFDFTSAEDLHLGIDFDTGDLYFRTETSVWRLWIAGNVDPHLFQGRTDTRDVGSGWEAYDFVSLSW